MAERYPPGPVRLWYRATGFAEGVNVVGDFRGPGGIRDMGLTFTEDSDGMYYLEYNFTMAGSYALMMFEDGVKKTSQNFLIEKLPSGGLRGSNLLNR